ncbi:MAG: histidinol-phosphatase HisJ family protein [Lachnospiraceae bacterium]|nr:histidinol-phosphatase HisJ family protein [Lachnospiraceae bacterium]
MEYDCHVHSSFSSDSKTEPEKQVQKAIELGMKGICFTDHMDYEFPNEERSGLSFIFDPDEYFKAMIPLKNSYSDRIGINIGVEIGLRNEEECRERVKSDYEKLTGAYGFDFVIGSTHCLEFTDPYYEDPYWTGKSVSEGIRTYLEAVLYNARKYDFDSLGHLDYLVRYVPESKGWNISDYRPSDHFDIIDEILKELIDSGRALEVNSAGLKYGLGFAHPQPGILSRYRELGGELITIGSDGHKPEHICYAFGDVAEILKGLGFRYYTVYKARHPEMIKIR